MAPRTPEAVPAHRPRPLRRVARWIGAGLLLPVLLIAAAIGALQTGPGKAWLAATLADVASDATGYRVFVGAIEGTVPNDMTVASLDIADAQGTWLSARDVALDWQPMELLAGRLSVARIAADTLELARAPVTPETAPAEAPAAQPPSFELPGLPGEVAIADIEIAELRLGAPLIGEAVTAAAFGSARLGGAPRDAELALTLLRLDGVPARIELLLSQSPARDPAADAALTLQADIEEPAGGLIARLLDLPDLPAVELHLAGSGPAGGWQGRLTAAAGDAAADLDITLALAERIDLALAGEVDPGGLLGAALRDVMPRPIAVDAALGIEPGMRIEIAHADLSAPGLDAHLEGFLDQEGETVEAMLQLAASDPALIAQIADPLRAAGLRGVVQVSGPLAAPAIDLDATIDRPAAPGVTAEALAVTATLAPAADGSELVLSVEATPQGLVIEGDDRLGPLVGAAPRLSLDGVLDLATLRLDVASLDVATAALTARGSGHVADSGRDVDLALRLRAADLAPLGALMGQPMTGALDADLQVTGDALAPRLAIDVDATGEGVALGDRLLAAIVGAAPRLVSSVTLDGATATVSAAELSTALATAQATGTVGDTLDLSLALSAQSLAGLSQPLGVDLAGGASATGRLTGPLDDPSLAAIVNGTSVTVAGVALGDPVADVSLAGLAGTPQGDLSLTAAPGGAALRARTAFRLEPDGGVRLDDFRVDGAGGTHLTGELALAADGLMAGTLTGEIADLSVWQGRAGTELAGAVGLRLTASRAEGAQSLALAASGRDLAAAGAVTVAEAGLEARLQDALGAPSLDARLTAQGVATDDVAFDTLELAARGGLDDLGWTLAATGDGEGSDSLEGNLDAQGRLALAAGGGTLTLASLSARLSDVELALARPATIAWDEAGLRVDGVDATLGDGRISGSGRLGDGAVALDATLADLPIGPLTELSGAGGLDGRLSGRVSLAGDPAAPDGRATFSLSDLREAGVDPAEAVALSGEANATLSAGRVDATARLFGPTDLALDAVISAPLVGDGPLAGKVAGGLDLALVPRIVDLRGDALSGRLDLDLALSGSRDRPQAGGRATISGGAYESAAQGTVLRDISAEVVGDNDRVRLAALEAGDGSGGRLSGTGSMIVDPRSGFPIDASVTLRKFAVLRRPDAMVELSGDLAIARDASGGSVAGRLSVDGAELRVPDRLGGEVVTLEVTEINLPPGREPKAPTPRAAESPLDLDIAVSIPGRAFLRGRGLDSEWRGDLHVGGTTAAPDIVGSLSVVRGALDLLGRTFRFDEGNVNFVGGDEIDPELDFTARSEAEALTVEADVSGTASAPSFALSSEPPLPEDEVLARLLFGSSAGNLTPVQAVQLAQTAATLSGRGGSVSVLDELRQGFGLDMLGVESGETLSSSSLAVGKYLTDDVFVKMNQGATPESRKLGVEVRILPQVTVESDIGAESQGSVGLNWKLDY